MGKSRRKYDAPALALPIQRQYDTRRAPVTCTVAHCAAALGTRLGRPATLKIGQASQYRAQRVLPQTLAVTRSVVN